jgi:hypothetical protein
MPTERQKQRTRERAAALAVLADGTPCPCCGLPLRLTDLLELSRLLEPPHLVHWPCSRRLIGSYRRQRAVDRIGRDALGRWTALPL